MNNLYEYNLRTNHRKLECDGLLCVEYQCMPGNVRSSLWSQHSYLVFIQSGTKTWITPDGEFPVKMGDAIFCRKGAHEVKNFYAERFCALIFFIPDDFIRDVIRASDFSPNQAEPSLSQVLPLQTDMGLQLFFESVIAYFLQQYTPSGQLLKCKFRELVLQIITGNSNPALKSYFFSLARSQKANLRQVMLDNYLYPLSQEEFAAIAHRSVSVFKRDFREIFGTNFSNWLPAERLKYARLLLLNSDKPVADIAFESGFESVSHFIRSFKKQYLLPPLQFRQQQQQSIFVH